MIDGRGILRYSRDVQRDRRTGKDNFLCKFADAFSPCEGIETIILALNLSGRPLMHLARVRVLKLKSHVFQSYGSRVMHLARVRVLKHTEVSVSLDDIDDAFSPCEGIETLKSFTEGGELI